MNEVAVICDHVTRVLFEKGAFMPNRTRALRAEPKNDEGVPIDWIEVCKSGLKPKHVPDRPDLVYADKWKGWEDFLGDEPVQGAEE